MSKEDAQFVYMTCRAGAETPLKEEVARTQPTWRLSFSRPGFLTFKCDSDGRLDERELAERHWTFAHAHGISLGRVTGSQLVELVQQVWQLPGVAAISELKAPLDIHVWQREPAVSDEEAELFVTPLCIEIEAALRAAAPEGVAVERAVATSRRATTRNSRVLDVVVVAPGEWWIGSHRAVRRAERWPGGVIPVRLPAHAVSRAYAKLEEAIQWSDLPLAKEDECVEIGCAPGGASQALLDRGMFVTGIDPADVDPAVVANPRFRHLKKRGSDVKRQEFLGVRWLVADMNIAPEDTLNEVEAIVAPAGVDPRHGADAQMLDWGVAKRIPEFVARVRAWGYRDVRTRQLVTGGQEFCLVALRRKALRRLAGKHGRKRKPRAKVETRTDQSHPAPPEPHF